MKTIEEQLSEALAQVESLTTANAALQADLDTTRASATTNLARAEQAETVAQTRMESLNTVTSERNTLTTNLATVTGERDAASAKAKKAEDDFAAYKADPKAFNADLRRELSKAGLSVPVAASGTSAVAEGATLTMAEFNTLTPSAKIEHFRNGGKLAE